LSDLLNQTDQTDGMQYAADCETQKQTKQTINQTNKQSINQSIKQTNNIVEL